MRLGSPPGRNATQAAHVQQSMSDSFHQATPLALCRTGRKARRPGVAAARQRQHAAAPDLHGRRPRVRRPHAEARAAAVRAGMQRQAHGCRSCVRRRGPLRGLRSGLAPAETGPSTAAAHHSLRCAVTAAQACGPHMGCQAASGRSGLQAPHGAGRRLQAAARFFPRARRPQHLEPGRLQHPLQA